MKILVHKQDPILALVFTPMEWHTNAHRCAEWAHTLQTNPNYIHELSEEGVVGIQFLPYGEDVVAQITFRSLEHIKEFLLARREIPIEEFVEVCRELGKDPNVYLSQAQVTGQQIQIFM